MSFESDVTVIKRLAEAEEPIFRPASPEEVAKRPKDYASGLKEVIETLIMRVNWTKHDLETFKFNTDQDYKKAASRLRLYLGSANYELNEMGL